MLQAVIHRKKWGRWGIEDYITSSFFGPMQYLDPGCIRKILQKIFDVDEWDDEPNKIRFEFWPRIGNEPDLLIRIGESRILHFEVKWHAGESSSSSKHQVNRQSQGRRHRRRTSAGGHQHQIHRQRKDIQKVYSLPGKAIESIYLVLDEQRAKKEMDKCELGSDARVVTWPEIGRRLRDWKDVPEGCWLWREHAMQYLRELTGRVFEGFTAKVLYPECSIESSWQLDPRGRLFFAAFHGFNMPIPPCGCAERDFIFYRGDQA